MIPRVLTIIGVAIVVLATLSAGCSSQRPDDKPQSAQPVSHSDQTPEHASEPVIPAELLPQLWMVATPVIGEPPSLTGEGTRWILGVPAIVYDGPSFQAIILEQQDAVFVSRQIGMDGRREWRGPLPLETVRDLAMSGANSP